MLEQPGKIELHAYIKYWACGIKSTERVQIAEKIRHPAGGKLVIKAPTMLGGIGIRN